ncbi:peptidoglycan-binding protein [Candidatus Saccharibacteria bacterium]|nr:peptidoglycan-binding protein [Candidatus Saccharibacteria bacterium]
MKRILVGFVSVVLAILVTFIVVGFVYARMGLPISSALTALISGPSQPAVVEPAATPVQGGTVTFVPSATPTPTPTPVPEQPVFIPGLYGTGATVGASALEPTSPTATPVSATFPAQNAYDFLSVVQIQQALNLAGLTTSVDGGYGPETATSIRQFQSVQHLGNIDGVTGPETAQALGVELNVVRNYHYEADLETIARSSSSDYLYYIATYNGATLTQFHRNADGTWQRNWSTPVSFNLSTDLSATNSLGIHTLASGFPTGLFGVNNDTANQLVSTCPTGTLLVIDDRNFTP